MVLWIEVCVKSCELVYSKTTECWEGDFDSILPLLGQLGEERVVPSVGSSLNSLNEFTT